MSILNKLLKAYNAVVYPHLQDTLEKNVNLSLYSYNEDGKVEHEIKLQKDLQDVLKTLHNYMNDQTSPEAVQLRIPENIHANIRGFNSLRASWINSPCND